MLDEDPGAAGRDFQQQFYSLIAKPFRLSVAGDRIVIVVDTRRM